MIHKKFDNFYISCITGRTSNALKLKQQSIICEFNNLAGSTTIISNIKIIFKIVIGYCKNNYRTIILLKNDSHGRRNATATYLPNLQFLKYVIGICNNGSFVNHIIFCYKKIKDLNIFGQKKLF